MVDAVNARPSACTSASRARPSPCRYGTAGMTNTPVAAVTSPVAAPATGPSQASCRAGTRSCSENSPASAYSISATPSATTAQAPLSAGSRAPPARVPAMTAASMGHRRRSRARRPGPAASCHRFVTSDGTIKRAAACTGGMTRLSVPMATVGKPSPTTPLTKPATRKLAPTASRNDVSIFLFHSDFAWILRLLGTFAKVDYFESA